MIVSDIHELTKGFYNGRLSMLPCGVITMPTRRQLIAGGATVSTAALAGCTLDFEFTTGGDENGENGEGENEEDEDYPFGIDEMLYTTERAEAFGDYNERTDGVFTGGESIYFYWEVSNVREANGDPIHLEYEIAGPDEEQLLSPEQEIEIPDLGDPPNDVFVSDGIDTAELEWYDPGDYSVDVTMTELATDESATASEPFTIESMRIDAIGFGDAETDEPHEHLLDDPVYNRGDENVYVVPQVLGAPVDTNGDATIEVTFNVENPGGDTWEPIVDSYTFEDAGYRVLMPTREYDTFDEDPVGEYEITVAIEEQITGEQYTDSMTATFELE